MYTLMQLYTWSDSFCFPAVIDIWSGFDIGSHYPNGNEVATDLRL